MQQALQDLQQQLLREFAVDLDQELELIQQEEQQYIAALAAECDARGALAGGRLRLRAACAVAAALPACACWPAAGAACDPRPGCVPRPLSAGSQDAQQGGVLCPLCQRAELVQLHGYIACPQDRFQLDVRSEGITLEHVRQRLAEAYQVHAAPLAGRLPACLAAWAPGWLQLAAWAPGWLAGWLPGWLQLAGCIMPRRRSCDAPRARRCLAGAPALRLQQAAAVLAQAAVGQPLAVRQLQQLRHAQCRRLSAGWGLWYEVGDSTHELLRRCYCRPADSCSMPLVQASVQGGVRSGRPHQLEAH